MVFGDEEMIDIDKITGIGGYSEKEWKDGDETNRLYLADKNEKAFLVVRPKTIEVKKSESKIARRI